MISGILLSGNKQTVQKGMLIRAIKFIKIKEASSFIGSSSNLKWNLILPDLVKTKMLFKVSTKTKILHPI